MSDGATPERAARRLDVIVLTSSVLGVELAAGLTALSEVRSMTVVTTGVMPGRRGFWKKLRVIHHHDGPAGVLRAAVGRITSRFCPGEKALAQTVTLRCPGARHVHCDDLHSPESLALLRSLAPDLGVVFAAYRLKPDVFTIPRLGCLNLHLGRAPEFRGSSPAFYEMLEGVPAVGVTIHRVSEGLDTGPIIAQESFPIDLAPKEDPVSYLRRYQAEVLVPNGQRLMAEALRRLAQGQVEERIQPPSSGPTRRRATYELKRELRRRVARGGPLPRCHADSGLIDIPTNPLVFIPQGATPSRQLEKRYVSSPINSGGHADRAARLRPPRGAGPHRLGRAASG